jgi:hypothetical protein
MRWSRLPAALLAVVALVMSTARVAYPHGCLMGAGTLAMAAAPTAAPADADGHGHHAHGAQAEPAAPAGQQATDGRPDAPAPPCDCDTDCCCTAAPLPLLGRGLEAPVAAVLVARPTDMPEVQTPPVAAALQRLPWSTGPPTHAMV